MNKIALILLLGFSFVVAENIDADGYAGDDETEYFEEVDEYVDEGVYDEDGVKANEAETEIEEADTDVNANVTSRDGDVAESTDITRWNYSEQDLAKKAASAKRKAKQEAEYKQSIKRKRSGLFFGGGVGYSGVSNLSELLTATSNGIGLGAFVGYQQAFNEYSGIRIYGEFDYNLGNGVFVANIDGKTYAAINTNWKGLGNVDFYLEGNMGRNYTETLGLFFGLGAGYMYNRIYSTNSNETHNYHLIAMNVNFGVHTILGTHHRIELFGRMYPYITPGNGTGANISNISSLGVNMDAWLRYSYMF